MATPDNMTAAQHTAAAHQADQEAQDSFDRCDTDGFLSQWASGMTGRLHRAKAEIAEQGGKAEFPALFDLAGNLVAAKLVETRYGMSLGILPDDSPDGSFVSWFSPSRARSDKTARANNARKGYYVGSVMAPANARTAGSGTGMSGCLSVYVQTYRTDGGFSRDVEIVDNGQAES